MQQKSPKERYEQIVTELPRLLPLCYLVMVCIGMMFNYFKFYFFDINIFQYATVFDFLVSPFEDPNIIWFMLLSPIIPIVACIVDYRWSKHSPDSYRKWSFGMSDKSWYRPFMRATYLILGISYVFLSSAIYGLYTHEKVNEQEDITVRYSDNETISGKQIGKVGNTLFLLNGSEVKVIPIEAYVKNITIPLQDGK